MPAAPRSRERAKLPIFTVGPATAALARELGFEQIIAGEGSASDLVPLIADSKIGEAGPLVHVAGEELAFDLAAELAARGVEVRKVTAYRAVAASSAYADIRRKPLPAARSMP